MDRLEELCSSTPHIARIFPSAAPNVPDYHNAGGVPAVMKQLLPLLHSNALTVSGRTIGDNVSDAPDPDGRVIRPRETPWSSGGGIAVLKGNLAPDTGITKPAAIHPTMQTFTGRARCFDSEEEANEAILDGKVQSGEVVVIRYEGPKGGPEQRDVHRDEAALWPWFGAQHGCGNRRPLLRYKQRVLRGTRVFPEAAEGGDPSPWYTMVTLSRSTYPAAACTST